MDSLIYGENAIVVYISLLHEGSQISAVACSNASTSLRIAVLVSCEVYKCTKSGIHIILLYELRTMSLTLLHELNGFLRERFVQH